MPNPTKRDKTDAAVLHYLRRIVRSGERQAPTNIMIAGACGFRSRATAAMSIKSLVRKGLITVKRGNQSRRIVVDKVTLRERFPLTPHWRDTHEHFELVLADRTD